MSRITDFYRGVGTDDRGRTLTAMWGFSDEQLESIHDFIQWMFPLREPSRFNPDAPLLNDADVAEFRADPRLRAHLRRSLAVFLAFVGLRLDGGRVVEAADFRRKASVWRHPNHNWLRVSRVLASTRILALEDESRAFFAFLKDLRDGGASGITPETFAYWETAAGRPARGETMG
jgi:hypothetical protein